MAYALNKKHPARVTARVREFLHFPVARYAAGKCSR